MFSKTKNLVTSLSLCLGLLLSVAAVAQAPAAGTTTTKVGIVSIQDAIAATNEGKKEFDALQQRFSPRNSELTARRDELEKLQAALQAQGPKLSDEERNARIKTATDKQKLFQRDGEDFQAEVQQAEQDVLNRLGKKMLDVLDKFAKDNGYSVILDVSNPQTPVLWASPATNITKELVDAYNAASGVAAPAAKPAATGTATKPAGTTTTPPKKP
jgi:outer membrane protein